MHDTPITDRLRHPAATTHDISVGRLADPFLVAVLFIGLSAAHWGLLNLAEVRWLRWVLDLADPNRFVILKAVFSWQVALLMVFLSISWAIHRLVIQTQSHKRFAPVGSERGDPQDDAVRLVGVKRRVNVDKVHRLRTAPVSHFSLLHRRRLPDQVRRLIPGVGYEETPLASGLVVAGSGAEPGGPDLRAASPRG